MFEKLLFLHRRKSEVDAVVLDMHSHFLPGIDDGASTLEESVEMISRMRDMGYTHLITTPHVMWDCYRNDPETILGVLEEVREACVENGIDIHLDAAAEYFIDEHFLELVNTNGELLTLPDNRILIELPFTTPLLNLSETIFLILSKGYKPVLAHPERYTYFGNNLEIYRQLVMQGCELQLNALSLQRYYGGESLRIAQWLLKNELITFLGSDAHHINHVKLLKNVRKDKTLTRYTFLNNKIK